MYFSTVFLFRLMDALPLCHAKGFSFALGP
jgi:hypothetical protein